MAVFTPLTAWAQVSRVSTGGDAVHYYFQVSPESPSGERIVYSVLRSEADETDVYVAKRDGSEPRRVATVPGISDHSGAKAIWVDEDRIAFVDAPAFEVHLLDLRSGERRVYPGDISHYSPVNRSIIYDSDSDDPLPQGIYSLNVDTGENRLLVPVDSMRRFAPLMKKEYLPKQWRLDHAYWSPDGRRINFQIKADPNSNARGDFIFFANADGSEIRYAGGKPMHIQWWDDGSVYGHDWHRLNDKYMRRYDLQGRMLETVAGHGNHGAVSPDRRWIVTESWYGSDPVVLRLYERGDTVARKELFSLPATVNGIEFWEKRSHMHPAFSRDGRRVYFNAIGPEDRGSQLYVYDLGSIIDATLPERAGRPSPPANVPGVEIPSADRLSGLEVEAHPRLFLTDERLKQLRRQVREDPRARDWYRQLKAHADSFLADPELPSYDIPDGLRLLRMSRRVLERVETLGLVGRIERDPRYRERVWREMEAAAGFPDWNPKHFLDVGEMTAALGIGYDWFYDDWTPAQRQVIREAIVRHGLRPALEAYAGNWIRTNWPASEHNWNQVTNGGVSIGALAILEEEPRIAGDVLHEALSRLPLATRHYGPDGAWNEGAGYWHYASLFNAMIVSALETAAGRDFGLSRVEGYDQSGWFPIYMTSPAGGSFAFADVGRDMGPTKGAELLWLATRFEEPAYAAHQFRYGAELDENRANALALIWYEPSLAGVDAPDPPLDRYFRVAEVVSMRSAWNDPDAIFVGFKAGDNKANHSNLDVGTFVLDALGVRWATELGRDDYNLPAYFSKDDLERWKYYRLRAEGQNTLVIGPDEKPDQDPYAATEIIDFESRPDRAHAVADLTPAYARTAGRVLRGIALLDGRERVLVQDEVSKAEPGEVWWFVHTEAGVDLAEGGSAAVLSRDGKRLHARILSPARARFRVMDARALPTSPDPGGQDPNLGIRKLAIELENVTDERIAVLFTPLEAGESVPGTVPALRPLEEW